MKYILTFILILLVFRFLGRLFFGFVIRNHQRVYQQPRANHRREGEVSIEIPKDKGEVKKRFRKSDFVEYDEVK